ncbi:hypothetical protein [Aeromicrobium sp.]|uniref:hypothetical protein n=2 Tax=Aeromicrobium sp. TaxID=1871063 RepID=UPI0035195499
MMRTRIAAAVLGIAVVLGVATAWVAAAPERGSQGGEQGEPSAGPGLLAPEQLVVAPGAVGPVRVGMTEQQALATGYFVADVADPTDGCPVRPLAWRGEYVDAVDVQTSRAGEVRSIGVRGEGVDTDAGLGVGSTYGELKGSTSDPEAVGFGQTGVFVEDSAAGTWIGFLFDESPDRLTDASRVSFVEVTKGARPELVRDGC